MADKMNEIVAILKERDHIDFLEYLGSHDSLEEALLAFFCLLELIKARRRRGHPGAALPHDQGLAAQGSPPRRR